MPAVGRIAAFDSAQTDLLDAFGRVPDAALTFRPAGDDYALSGLMVHVASVLENYTRALQLIVEADWSEISVDVSPNANDVLAIRDGIAAADRRAVEERIRTAHQRLVGSLGRLNEQECDRKAPVRYGQSADPFFTSAADILDWTREHYQEHVTQIHELLTAWRSSPISP